MSHNFSASPQNSLEGHFAGGPDSHRGVVGKVVRIPTRERMLYTGAHTRRQQRACVRDPLSGSLTTCVRSPRPLCQSEGLVWWQDPGSAWSGLGAAGKVILGGTRLAAARSNPALVLEWL